MRWAALIAAGLFPLTLGADPLRVATYHTELTRDGPGLLLADIIAEDPQVLAVSEVIVAAAPDILVVQGFDHDAAGHALYAFRALLAEKGLAFDHAYAARPNSGVPSGLDLDGNGRLGEAKDSWGYGSFTGQGGMALLSRYPLGEARAFTEVLWRDLPGADVPMSASGPFPSQAVHDRRPLSSVAHWDVPVIVDQRPIHILAWHGSTPIFDGPEDLNGRRGADEARFWQLYLDGALDLPPPSGPVILAGVANIDPFDGDGRHHAIRALLDDPRLQDPEPRGSGASSALNDPHQGDPALDTADFEEPEPGNLRVDYLLPDARLTVRAAGVLWPGPNDPFARTVAAASRHRLVWVDIDLP